jgi:pimeloyl-ACP methyl ester carboxylesterase
MIQFTKTVYCFLVSLFFTISIVSTAQIAPSRTWPELKEAVQDRVNAQRYPMVGFDAKEVAEILGHIQSLDRDEWAKAWIEDGDKHFQKALSLKVKNIPKAREEYFSAWRYYSFGAWPTQNSEQKERAYALSTNAFREYAQISDPRIETIRIPFEGKEIVVYLQKPKGVKKPAVVISSGGFDSYKEFVVDQFGPDYLKAGLAYVAIDMPGTGESPLKADVGSERIFSRVIDFLQTRNDIDSTKFGFQGVSWGGHWAARIAYDEPYRLKAVVVWGGPIHEYFQRNWQLKALGTREYLFDLFEARSSVYGVNTLEEFLAFGPKMSLKDSGKLSQVSAPQLLVNGDKDTQVPIEDVYILLKNGDPKEAWINPMEDILDVVKTGLMLESSAISLCLGFLKS